MAWYFDKKTTGFVTTLVYGERTIELPDPDFVPGSDEDERAPLIVVPNPLCMLPPEEQLVLLTDDEYAALFAGQAAGKQIVRGKNGKPELVDPLPPSADDMAAAANSKRDSLLAVAALRIAPLADAVELGDATAADEASLKKWKQYRVAVNRVDQQKGFPASIEWPPMPGEPTP